MKKPSELLLISETIEKPKKAGDDTRAKAIGDLITEKRALGDQPFTLIEDRGFSRLVNHSEAGFTLQSCRYLSDV